jgi:hypothetical protein
MSQGIRHYHTGPLTEEEKEKYQEKVSYPVIERPRLLEEGFPLPPDYAFWVAIVYLLKNKPEMLKQIVNKFFDTQAKMINSLAQSAAGNIITAYSHSFLIALMLEQNYMIRQRGADDLIVSLNWLTAAQELTNIVQGFAVPEVLTFASTGGQNYIRRSGQKTTGLRAAQLKSK